ncbi:MAG TPA: PsbP-related protein [Candidatus Paceibacterota bacterium]|nr:PsbP-related protein [Candidatus Paceibacterota bacterium]
MKKIVVTAVVVIIIGFFVFNYVLNKNFQRPEFTSKAPDVNTPKSSATEKKFSDSKRGFEFLYPANLSWTGGSGSWNSDINEFKNPNGAGTIDDIQFWITPNQTDLESYFNLVRGNALKKGNIENIIIDVNVDGVQAKKVTVKSRFTEGLSVYFYKGGNGYSFTANKNLESGLDSRPILDKMITTFKFVK